MLLTELRNATASEHQALEQTVRLLDPELTVRAYVQIVRTFHAFVSQWEDVGRTNCPAPMAPAFLARQREALLATDLEFFVVSPLVSRPLLPDFSDPSRFYGAMYVMEGSSLGGQLIARHLEKQFGFVDRAGYAYFYGRGPETGRLWKDFCSQLEEYAVSLDFSHVIAGARQMFKAFQQWIIENTCEDAALLGSTCAFDTGWRSTRAST